MYSMHQKSFELSRLIITKPSNNSPMMKFDKFDICFNATVSAFYALFECAPVLSYFYQIYLIMLTYANNE